MTWTVTQNATSFSGTLTMTDTATGIAGHGTVSGTASGSGIHFSINVGEGGFDEPYAACTVTASGDGQVSASALSGTYAGSNSCTGTIASGQFTLNRQ
jgi:hypothetical protein